MKHTSKMLLIPEDVYKSLLSSPKKSLISAGTDPDKELMDRSKLRIKKIRTNKRINPDERQIRLLQEFKRYKKYKNDFDEKPINVHMKNIDALLDERRNSYADKGALTGKELQFNTALVSPLVEKEGEDEEENESSNINKYSPRRLRKQIKRRKIFSPYENKKPRTIERNQLFKNSQNSPEDFETPLAAFKPSIW